MFVSVVLHMLAYFTQFQHGNVMCVLLFRVISSPAQVFEAQRLQAEQQAAQQAAQRAVEEERQRAEAERKRQEEATLTYQAQKKAEEAARAIENAAQDAANAIGKMKFW